MLRESYLPETILAYTSALQFAGFTLSRDYLLEGLDLATTIAADDSDLAEVFVHTGRMPELVESFARISKAVLQLNKEGKSKSGSGGKKMRDSGWSRTLWDIQA